MLVSKYIFYIVQRKINKLNRLNSSNDVFFFIEEDYRAIDVTHVEQYFFHYRRLFRMLSTLINYSGL